MPSRQHRLISVALLTALYLGTASTGAAQPRRGPPTDEQRATMCPTALTGSSVRFQELPDGAAMQFSISDPKQLEELRLRASHLAHMEVRYQQQGQMHRPMHGPVITVPSDISTELTSNGMRVLFRAHDSAQVAELQTQVRARTDMLQTGDCPMMQMQMDQMRQQEAPPAPKSKPDTGDTY